MMTIITEWGPPLCNNIFLYIEVVQIEKRALGSQELIRSNGGKILNLMATQYLSSPITHTQRREIGRIEQENIQSP